MHDEPARLPATDTRPIPFGELTGDERELLGRLHDAIEAIRRDVKDRRLQPAVPGGLRRRARDVARVAPSPSPWAEPDRDRTHRTLFLTGPRGTGKTSLLLTLQAAWRGDDRDDDLARRLADQGRAVRALPTLDFDPRPDHLHPYAWLVQSLEPIVTALEDDRTSPCAGFEVEERSLREHWQVLYKQALLGWNDGVVERMLVNDIDEYIYAQLEGHRGWHRLRDHWQRFVDRLLADLEAYDDLPTDGLLVISIDDLDFQPGLAKELLLALRLAWHPRVVYLVNGHEEHLLRVLELELYREERRVAQLENWRRQFDRAADLARDLYDKSIPPAYRFEVPHVNLHEALTRIAEGMELRSWLETILPEDAEHDPGLIDSLMATIESSRLVVPSTEHLSDSNQRAPTIIESRLDGFRWRDVVGVLDEYSKNGVRRLWALLRLARNRNGDPVFERREGDERDASGPIELIPVARWTSEFNQFARVEDLDFYVPSGDGRLSRAPRSVVLALDFMAAGVIHRGGIGIRMSDEPVPMAATRFGTLDYVLEIPWPSKPARSPRHARKMIRWPDRHSRGENWLLEWACLQLAEADVLREGTGREDWESLLASLQAWAGADVLDDWPVRGTRSDLLLRIGLIAAPEYGLETDRQGWLLARLREIVPPERWEWFCDRLDEERGRALQRALDPVRRAGRTDLGVEAVLRDIEARHPDAPWASKKQLVALDEDWPAWTGVTRASIRDELLRARFNSPRGRVRLAALMGTQDGSQFRLHPELRRLGETLKRRGLLRAWHDALLETSRRRRAGGAALILLDLWRALADLGGETAHGLAEWLEASEDGETLLYRGPRLNIKPVFRGYRQIERATGVRTGSIGDWLVLGYDFDEVELGPAYRAWLLVVQSMLARKAQGEVSELRVVQNPWLMAGRTTLESLSIPAWSDYQVVSMRWSRILSEAAAMVAPTTPGPAIRHWLVACWLTLMVDGARGDWSDAVSADYEHHLIDFPVQPGFFRILASEIATKTHESELRRWAGSLDLEDFLSAEAVNAWREGLGLHGEPRAVTVRGVEFSPPLAERALAFVNEADAAALRAVFQPRSVQKILGARPVKALEALGRGMFVGPETAKKLRAHVEKSG